MWKKISDLQTQTERLTVYERKSGIESCQGMNKSLIIALSLTSTQT